jgi:hypothetical protein
MKRLKPLAVFLVCVVITFLSAGLASLAQTDFDRITVTSGFF